MSLAAKFIIEFIADKTDSDLENFIVNKLSAWEKRSVNDILETDLHINRLREDFLDAKEAKKRSIKGIVTIPADPFEMAEQAATLFDLNEYIYQRIWLTFMDDHDIPDDFEDTAYSNDAAPSISHTSGRIMVWFHDRDTWDDIGWHDELKKYQVHYHPTEHVYGETDEEYTNKSVNTWAEVLEIIEEWRKTQTEDEPQTYKDSFEGDQCPECGEFSVSGEVFRATGAKLDSGYQPSVGETLKFISMECSECDFDQYS